MIVTVANVSMSAPGVVHHDYTDAPLAPQSEDWRLVSWPHPDYALVTTKVTTPILEFIAFMNIWGGPNTLERLVT